MFPRVSRYKSGGRWYRHLKLVESYREKGKVKQRILANLGNIDKFKQSDVDNLINGLCRIFERPTPSEPVQFIEAPAYGDIHAIIHIWRELKLAQILQAKANKSRKKFDLESHIQMMVVNRLCDPKSKLALLAWLEGVYLPGVDRSKVKYENLLRAMDWLVENKEQVELELANSVLTLFNKELDIVFYDMTSSYFETELTDELRKYGFSRDKRGDCPQVTIGMVCTREGIPICHHVFSGNTPDKTTVKEVIRDLKRRFPVTRAVFVGDRGMLTRQNIDVIRSEGLEYIVAVNMRHDRAAEELIADFDCEVDEARALWHEQIKSYESSGKLPRGCKDERELRDKQRLFSDATIQGRRLVIEHSEHVAKVSSAQRAKKLERTQEGVALVIGKLEDQDLGKKSRGRALSEAGALIKLHEVVSKNRMGATYELKLEDGQVKVTFDELALGWEAALDGKLVVETSLEDLSAEQVIEQYRELRLIEDAFRVLKSSLELRPMHHWTPTRIKSHVFICVLALVLERVMRLRLRNSAKMMLPSRALEKLRSIRAIFAKTSTGRMNGLTRISEQQQELFDALGVPVPDFKELK